jgi:hypothetical protein
LSAAAPLLRGTGRRSGFPARQRFEALGELCVSRLAHPAAVCLFGVKICRRAVTNIRLVSAFVSTRASVTMDAEVDAEVFRVQMLKSWNHKICSNCTIYIFPALLCEVPRIYNAPSFAMDRLFSNDSWKIKLDKRVNT